MEGIESLRERVEALAELAGVDPDALDGDQALLWAGGLMRARNALDALAAPVVRRLDELSQGPERFARSKGYSGAAALLSGETGVSASDAHRLIALGNAMVRTVEVPAPASAGTEGAALDIDALEAPQSPGVPAQPTLAPVPALEPPRAPVQVLSPLALAARAGRLGAEKIRVIETTVAAMSIDTAEFEADAVAKAARLSIRQLRVWCLAQFAERDPQAYADRQERQRSERYLAFIPQPDGMVGVHGLLDAETAGHVLSWFGPEARARMSAQRDWDEAEKLTIGQINADVLTSLAKHAEGCEQATTRPKSTVVVRVPLEVLENNAGFGMCDALEGPVSVGVLRRMAVDAEFLPVVLGGASLPLDVGRARRAFTGAQRTAIGERDGGCAMCGAPMAWCDTHHIQFWSRKGRSDLRNGVMLCVGCHHRVHDYGWQILVSADSEVEFIPPATVDPHRRRQLSRSVRLAS